MKKLAIALAVFMMVVGLSGLSRATVINFDDIGSTFGVPDPNNPDSGMGEIPNGYAGFSWSMFGVMHKDYALGTGYEFGVVSGTYAAFNEYAEVATVDGRLFVFRSAYFTSALDDILQVIVTGYRAGNVVYSVTVDTNIAGPILYQFPTEKIDTLQFASGTDFSPFVLDDLTYSTIPVVDAGPNVPITSDVQETTIVQGTASNEDGASLLYRWLEGSTPLSTWQSVGPNGEASLDLAPVPIFLPGDHTLTLEVQASDSGITESDTMILTIANSAPHAAPDGAGTYNYGIAIAVGGQVADYDGDTLTYKWLEGSTVLFEGTVATVYAGASVDLPDYTIPAGLSVGTHTLTLWVSDGVNAPVLKTITVIVKAVDHCPPKLCVRASDTVLTPAYHQMEDITIQVHATDNSGGAVILTATVTSDEPQTGLWPNDPSPDWTTPVIDQVTGKITLKLRAERSDRGDGRVYKITITATDPSGNMSTAVVKITVPRSCWGGGNDWHDYWHKYWKSNWNRPDYREWFDNWYGDWFRGWCRH